MRSPSKASTTGSNQRQVVVRRLAGPTSVFVALVTAMAFVVAPASATKTHLFKEFFGPIAQPTFSLPQSVTVDESTGEILVMDANAQTISRYNPDGTPADFSGLGTNVIDGIGNGECATVPADCDQTPENGLSFGSPSESQIAVDNSSTATDGNIYVTQSSPNLINVFSDEGKYLGQLSAAGATPFNEACGVAVDPSGAVYVGDYNNGIHKFVPGANPPVDADNTATFSSVTQPCALAAGAGPTAGSLFAVQYNGPLSKLSSGTGEVEYVVSPDTTRTVTVDPLTGYVYAIVNGATIKAFDASGAGAAITVANAAPGNGDFLGIAVRASTGELYLSRANTDRVEVFGPPVPLPEVTTAAASNLDKESVTLNGTVNPGGAALEECKFEYGLTVSYGQIAPCAEALGTIGSGTSPVPVHADITDLSIATAYHYRLVAKNENGLVNGEDETAQTAGPVLADVWTDDVIRTEATLKATINPEGNPTTYRVEWGPDATYGQSTPEVAVGSDDTVHVVSRTLGGLAPGTTYHWRIVVTNSAAVNEGPDSRLHHLSTACAGNELPKPGFP